MKNEIHKQVYAQDKIEETENKNRNKIAIPPRAHAKRKDHIIANIHGRFRFLVAPAAAPPAAAAPLFDPLPAPFAPLPPLPPPRDFLVVGDSDNTAGAATNEPPPAPLARAVGSIMPEAAAAAAAAAAATVWCEKAGSCMKAAEDEEDEDEAVEEEEEEAAAEAAASCSDLACFFLRSLHNSHTIRTSKNKQ